VTRPSTPTLVAADATAARANVHTRAPATAIGQRNREIVRRRDTGETLQSIADAYGLTRERVRQITEELEPGINARVRTLRRLQRGCRRHCGRPILGAARCPA
jgi:DNA-directed RNA polymerase sigma subunit (sigma70/sigma32)